MCAPGKARIDRRLPGTGPWQGWEDRCRLTVLELSGNLLEPRREALEASHPKAAREPIAGALRLAGNRILESVDGERGMPSKSPFAQHAGQDVELAQPPETTRYLSKLPADAALSLVTELEERDQLAQTA
jgi:hypothetical protein